jgi:hypothetical protein
VVDGDQQLVLVQAKILSQQFHAKHWRRQQIVAKAEILTFQRRYGAAQV